MFGVLVWAGVLLHLRQCPARWKLPKFERPALRLTTSDQLSHCLSG
jgi:hypothetical protein